MASEQANETASRKVSEKASTAIGTVADERATVSACSIAATVDVIGDPVILENIYTHQGETGHEVTFVSDVTFPSGAYRGNGPIEYFEDNGQKCIARWYDLTDLDCGGLELYPNGLKAKLLERRDTAAT